MVGRRGARFVRPHHFSRCILSHFVTADGILMLLSSPYQLAIGLCDFTNLRRHIKALIKPISAGYWFVRLYNTSLLLTVSWVHLLTPSSQHAIVSPSAAYRAVRNSTQSVDSSPPMKRQRSLKVELVVSSPCHQIRGPTGRRRRRPFYFLRRKAGPGMAGVRRI